MAAGWVWFSGLQLLWPPFLTKIAPPFLGGGTLFYGFMCIGFPILGLALGGRGAFPPLRRLSPHLLHGIGLPFIVIVMGQEGAPSATGAVILLSLLAALAYIGAGLFWGNELFSLPAPAAGPAFFCSALTAALIALAAALLDPAWRGGILLFLWIGAWAASLLLEQPPKIPAPVRSGGNALFHFHAKISFSSFAFLLPSMFFLGLLEGLSVTAGEFEPAPPVFCLYEVWGAAAALGALLFLPKVKKGMIASLAFIVHALEALGGHSMAFLQVTDGAVSLLVIVAGSLFFAGIKTWSGRISATGVIAGLITLLVNGGFALGGEIQELLAGSYWIAGIGGIAALAVALCGGQEGAALKASKSAEHIAPNPVLAEQAGKADAKEVFPQPLLTAAEQRVLRLINDGYSNSAISDALEIAPATTRVHLRNIHRKLGTHSREELKEVIREKLTAECG